MNTIKDLRNGNKFEFNNIVYVVIRKWINEDRPLIAKIDKEIYEKEIFYNEELEITKI